MNDFYTYSILCLQNWWLYLAAVPFVVDVVSKLFFPRFTRRMDRTVAPKFRKECEVILIGIAVFLAGFSAYENEILERQQFEIATASTTTPGSQENSADDPDVAQLRSKVDSLEKQTADLAANAWPALTDDQIEEWSKQLALYKVTFVSIAYEDESSKALRDSLIAVFKKAKWPAPLMMTGAGGGIGITFKTTDDQAVGPELENLFQQICSQVKWDASTDVVAGVQINIGQKPVSNLDIPVSAP